jgi:DNA anti-recombination protein RmuC
MASSWVNLASSSPTLLMAMLRPAALLVQTHEKRHMPLHVHSPV